MFATLSDTVDALLPDWPPLDESARREVLAECTGFVRGQIRRAPFHVRSGLRVLFAAYAVYAFLRAGPFTRRDRLAWALGRFSALPLPMVAMLERALRSMVLLAFFEQNVVLAALGEETPGMRQASFRAKRADLADKHQ